MDDEKIIAQLSKSELLQKAINASAEGITISTMSGADRPLIYVNEGFQRLTGYGRDEVIGKNCRFLQGDETDSDAVAQIREAIAQRKSCTVELLNYKKDGTPFWNRLSITPIYDNLNNVSHYVGIQSDITEHKVTEERLQAANKDLQIFRNHIMQDLERAKIAQSFLLPSKLPASDSIAFASLFTPMEKIGGDLYDILEMGNNTYGLLMADVTGHGLPAALLTFMSSITFKNAANESLSPAETITLINARLFRQMPGESFVTMFYAIYNSETKVLTYTQAGHPECYILRPTTNEVIPLTTDGTLIGVFSNDEVSFAQKEITLLPGDKLVMYTDAITDALDNATNNIEHKDLSGLLLSKSNLSLKALFDEIYQYGLHCGDFESYPDDFTLLGMEVLQ